MKTGSDPRHRKRISRFKRLYAASFIPGVKFDRKVDTVISKNAPDWPINKLNRVDLAILRLAISELREARTPPRVIVDEAVEIAKTYGTAKTPKFINGVLGNLVKK